MTGPVLPVAPEVALNFVILNGMIHTVFLEFCT